MMILGWVSYEGAFSYCAIDTYKREGVIDLDIINELSPEIEFGVSNYEAFAML